MKNRFDGLKTAKTLQKSTEALKPEAIVKVQPEEVGKKHSDIRSKESNTVETRKRGRPTGKRSNDNFRQVTAYVGKETYKKTKMKLLAADNQQEFSELIDDLLIRWLAE